MYHEGKLRLLSRKRQHKASTQPSCSWGCMGEAQHFSCATYGLELQVEGHSEQGGLQDVCTALKVVNCFLVNQERIFCMYLV